MLWIVGKTFSELERYLEAHRIPFGLFADKALGDQPTRAITTVYLDFTHDTALRASLQDTTCDVSGLLLAGYEPYVIPTAWLAAHFGVPGPSVQAATAATNKAVMRQALRAANAQIAPDWALVASEADLDQFVSHHNYPVVLKPTNLMKSLYVSRNANKDMLHHNYHVLRNALQQSKAGSGQSQIIVEEYMAGSMHTLAGFVDKRGEVQLAEAVTDCITAHEIGMDDTYIAERHIPSKLGAQAIELLQNVAKQGVEALQLRSSALHIEIMLTPTGPKIIEIAARIGGYRARMYQYASGIDLYGALIATATNQTINLSAQVFKYSCAIEVFPIAEGRLVEITNLQVLQQLASVLHIRQQHNIGAVVGPAKAGYRACLNVVLGSSSRAKLEKDVMYVRNNVRAHTKLAI